MLTRFKINIAVIIFLAFIFRLIFLNASLLSSFVVSSYASQSAQISSLLHNHTTELNSPPNTRDYAAIEVFEESSNNEEDVVKADFAVVLFLLCSLVRRFTLSLSLCNPFGTFKSNLFSRRYLALSILRI